MKILNDWCYRVSNQANQNHMKFIESELGYKGGMTSDIKLVNFFKINIRPFTNDSNSRNNNL